jgi:hypothetical protein
MKIQLPHIPDDWDRVATVLILFIIVAIMFAVSGCTLHTSPTYGTHIAVLGKGTYSSNSTGMGGSYDQEKAVGAIGSSIITGIITSGVENIVGSNIGGQLVDSTNTKTAADVTKTLGSRTPTITTEGQTAVFAPTK